MKLFVWEDERELTDYSDGMVVVLARDEAEAWAVLKETDEVAWRVLSGIGYGEKVVPKEYPVNEKRGFVVWGGG